MVALEIEAELAQEARRSLSSRPWVEVRHGDGGEWVTEGYDALLVNAGVTHLRPEWMDGLSPAGRIVLPLTATMPPMGAIGKGLLLLSPRRPVARGRRAC